MGSLLSYSGLSAKIRAMKAKLTSKEQFQEIAQMGTVAEVINFLKRMPAYRTYLADLDENAVHREDAEVVLRRTIFRDYTKIYHFANPEQRNFLSLYFKQYELGVIKDFMHNIYRQGDSQVDYSVYLEFFNRHSKLNLPRLAQCDNMQELVEALRGSEYYIPVAHIGDQGMRTEFDYGMALDLYYFNLIWKGRKKIFLGQDLKDMTKAYGQQFDLLNLQWIERSKRYYHMSSTEIYALLIPVNYRISQSEMSALVEAGDEEEFRGLVAKTYYGERYQQWSDETLELFYDDVVNLTLHQESASNPYSVVIMYSYLYNKEQEVEKLITAIECVRYGMKPEETLQQIHLA